MDQYNRKINLVSTFWKEVWNRKNFTFLDKLIHDDYYVTSLSNPDKIIKGREAIEKNVTIKWTDYNNFKLGVSNIYCDGNNVISVIKLSGNKKNTGKYLSMDEIVVHTIDHDKIIHALSLSTEWKLG